MSLAGRRVLYISYNGMLDALGQSQVLPYLRELAKKGISFTLLSFERPAAFEPEGLARCEQLRDTLAREHIEWHWLAYHQSPSLPATAYDVMNGIRYASQLVKRNQIELVHARSHIAATIGLALKKRFGLKLIFDIRGLMAEEYGEAGHWKEGGLPYKVTKALERRLLKSADGFVTLTNRIWSVIKDWEGLRDKNVNHAVVPCCADLELFRFRETDRTQRRRELGLGERFTLVYSGSIGPWYLSDKMVNLFVKLLSRKPDAHFLWLTMGDGAIVDKLMRDQQIAPSHYTVLRAEQADVPSYLAAADLGIAFYKPGFSKLATSPVKVTEYLSLGLPIVINRGIGDSDSLVENEHVGVLVRDFTADSYSEAVAKIEALSADPLTLRKRARAVAEKLFDLRTIGAERYADLYQRVLES
jgi:glycosyltransferase involved in cell wall biosynthesis